MYYARPTIQAQPSSQILDLPLLRVYFIILLFIHVCCIFMEVGLSNWGTGHQHWGAWAEVGGTGVVLVVGDTGVPLGVGGTGVPLGVGGTLVPLGVGGTGVALGVGGTGRVLEVVDKALAALEDTAGEGRLGQKVQGGHWEGTYLDLLQGDRAEWG